MRKLLSIEGINEEDLCHPSDMELYFWTGLLAAVGCFFLFVVRKWFQKLDYFPIKLRSPYLILISNIALLLIIVTLLLQYSRGCYAIYGVIGTHTEAYVFTFVQKLLSWPYIFLTVRLAAAYSFSPNKASSNVSKFKQVWQSIIKSEYKMSAAALLLCAIGTVIEVEWILVQEEGSNLLMEPYDNFRDIVNASLQTAIFIALCFILRKVHRSHTIIKELLWITFMLYVVNVANFAVKEVIVRTRETNLYGIILGYNIIRFIVMVTITMVLPLKKALSRYLPLPPTFVLYKFDMFFNEKDCLPLFVKFIDRRPGGQQERDLLAFVFSLRLVQLRPNTEKDEDELTDIHETYFNEPTDSLFTPEIEELVNGEAYQGFSKGKNSYGWMSAHHYAMSRLEAVFHDEFRRTKAFAALEKYLMQNHQFDENLVRYNMLNKLEAHEDC